MNESKKADGKSLWAKAKAMAEKAPPERNRYVDFLRAMSILAVVVGHWLVAAPYMVDGDSAVKGGHLLEIVPWTQWLTWGFQVMPVFFMVGGFSNGTSWAANRRKIGTPEGTYSHWYSGRVRRLINPVLPLFLIWTFVAMFGTMMGIDRTIVKMAAQWALIPVWFLSVYLMVSAVVPWSYAAWQRWGMATFWVLVAGAVVVDVLGIHYHVPYVKFLNFAFVWLAVHQLGYAWAQGYFKPPVKALMWGIGGLVALGLLVGIGPYPIAMIGVPGNEITNSMPPNLAMLALGITQIGLALSIEPQMRRLLDNINVWTAVVLINGMIMTIYLWHLTAQVIVVIAAWMMGGIGLHMMPGSAEWWLTRPIWFVFYILALIPMIARFARYEQSDSRRGIPPREDTPHWRLIVGLVMICAGLAMSAAISIASPAGVTGVRLWVVALPFVGAAMVGFGPVRGLIKRVRE